MSGQTADGVADAQEPPAAAGEPTVRELIADALDGERPEAIAYRENVGSLDAPESRWHRAESIAALPDRRFGGWDELYVYTETHVYRWVGVGFDAGPERLPRDPSALPDGD